MLARLLNSLDKICNKDHVCYYDMPSTFVLMNSEETLDFGNNSNRKEKGHLKIPGTTHTYSNIMYSYCYDFHLRT